MFLYQGRHLYKFILIPHKILNIHSISRQSHILGLNVPNPAFEKAIKMALGMMPTENPLISLICQWETNTNYASTMPAYIPAQHPFFMASIFPTEVRKEKQRRREGMEVI